VVRGRARQSNKGIINKGWEVYPEGQRLFNDPSAGSPTETLLRLLLPLNDQVWTTFQLWVVVADLPEPVRKPHLAIQSVVATGGVYKGQGRSRHELMTRAY
jgi:hypothetical protein